MRPVPTLALLAGLALAGCGSVQNYLGGEDNSEPPAELVDVETTLQVVTRWSRDVGSGVGKQYLKLRPSLYADRVFAADHKGRVTAFDAATGEEVWDTATKAPISGGPGTGEGLVLVGTTDGEVLALDAEGGELLWRTAVSSEVLSPPSADRGIAIARTIDGKIFGLDTGDGTRRWVYDRSVPALTLRGTSTPAIAEGVVVAGFDSGRLVALALSNGQPLWESRVAVPRGRTELERLIDLDADPIIARGIVYAVTFQGRVAAVDLRTGAVLWQRDMSSHAGVGVDRRNVYVTDESSHVWALDRSTSASVWRQQALQARSVTSPTSFRDYVVVGDFEGYLHWMAKDDGRFVARTKVGGDGILAPPLAADDMLYVYGAGGHLAALAIEP